MVSKRLVMELVSKRLVMELIVLRMHLARGVNKSSRIGIYLNLA